MVTNWILITSIITIKITWLLLLSYLYLDFIKNSLNISPGKLSLELAFKIVGSYSNFWNKISKWQKFLILTGLKWSWIFCVYYCVKLKIFLYQLFTIIILIKIIYIFFLVSAALVTVNFFMEPHKRGFFCDDQTLMYPYIAHTVFSTSKVIILGFVFLFLVRI